MKNITSVIKKEFARFFGDKRMVFSTLILPGLMIYLLYTFMGSGLQSMFVPDEDYVPSIYVVNAPQSVSGLFSAAGLETTNAAESDVSKIKQDITDKNADLCIVFPLGFDEIVDKYEPRLSAGLAPNIEIYYNSASNNSIMAYSNVTALLVNMNRPCQTSLT
jgi:ABC-type Na+ efflux pump, permease component